MRHMDCQSCTEHPTSGSGSVISRMKVPGALNTMLARPAPCTPTTALPHHG